jgi:hypothetical protein
MASFKVSRRSANSPKDRVFVVLTNAGDGTGWRESSPLSNPPGTALADKLMDAQNRRDRAERIAQEERTQAVLGRKR